MTLPHSTFNKLSDRLAYEIEREIIRLDWPVNRVLGSEAELVSRYRVGRTVLREAIRLLEQRGAVRMRSGPGGGLVVAAPAEDALVELIATHLTLAGASTDEVLDMRLLLEQLAVTLATRRADADTFQSMQRALSDLERVRGRHASLRRLGELQHLIGQASGNPALQLVIDVLTRMNREYLLHDPTSLMHFVKTRNDAVRMQGDIVRAVMDHDVARAIAAVRRSVAASRSVKSPTTAPPATAQRLQRALRKVRRQLSRDSSGSKLAQTAAQLIQRELQEMACPPGLRLGSEAQLREAIDVSAAVFRETLCILQQHSLVRMGKGRGGGIYVTAPDPANICRSAVLYLSFMRLAPCDYLPLRLALDVEAVRLAAARCHNDADRGRLLALLNAPAAADVITAWPLIEEQQLTIADCCGNRILQLILRIMAGMTTDIRKRSEAEALEGATLRRFRQSFPKWLRRKQRAVVVAILDRDEDSACRAAQALSKQLFSLLSEAKSAAAARASARASATID